MARRAYMALLVPCRPVAVGVFQLYRLKAAICIRGSNLLPVSVEHLTFRAASVVTVEGWACIDVILQTELSAGIAFAAAPAADEFTGTLTRVVLGFGDEVHLMSLEMLVFAGFDYLEHWAQVTPVTLALVLYEVSYLRSLDLVFC